MRQGASRRNDGEKQGMRHVKKQLKKKPKTKVMSEAQVWSSLQIDVDTLSPGLGPGEPSRVRPSSRGRATAQTTANYVSEGGRYHDRKQGKRRIREEGEDLCILDEFEIAVPRKERG